LSPGPFSGKLAGVAAEGGRTNGCGIVELRRYALHPGSRETLIELFEREFVETQEAVGIRVLGTFRDMDDPNSFVWLRGFADMSVRAAALRAFYGGPVWTRHREAANATMIDSDDVLLLRPLDEASRLDVDPSRRPPPGAPAGGSAVASLMICPLEPTHAAAFPDLFASEIEPELRRTGATVRGRFVTEHGKNDYPALPVREGEDVFVWVSQFAGERDRDEHLGRLDLHTIAGEHLRADPECHRLEPTRRSLLPDR
jgi:hypothetical protein